VVTKPKTAWCQSHIQRQPVEEDTPAEAAELMPEQSLPIYTPLLDDEDDTSGEASFLDEAVAMAVGEPTPPLQRSKPTPYDLHNIAAPSGPRFTFQKFQFKRKAKDEPDMVPFSKTADLRVLLIWEVKLRRYLRTNMMTSWTNSTPPPRQRLHSTICWGGMDKIRR